MIYATLVILPSREDFLPAAQRLGLVLLFAVLFLGETFFMVFFSGLLLF